MSSLKDFVKLAYLNAETRADAFGIEGKIRTEYIESYAEYLTSKWLCGRYQEEDMEDGEV